MAVSISACDVKKGFTTTVSDVEINLLIDIVSEADPCLDAAKVPDSRQQILKTYAVRHMLQLQANGGKGVVTSQSAPSGASQSFSAWRGVGVTATPFGSMLKQLDASGCIVSLLENDGPNLAIMSVGGCA